MTDIIMKKIVTAPPPLFSGRGGGYKKLTQNAARLGREPASVV